MILRSAQSSCVAQPRRTAGTTRQREGGCLNAVTDDLYLSRVNDFLPAGKQNVGGSGSAGPTVTAGGFVFVGATDDRCFRAFDSKTGKEL